MVRVSVAAGWVRLRRSRADGGGLVIGDDESKRKSIVKGPRPPRWSTVNGIKAMLFERMAQMVSSAEAALDMEGVPMSLE
jgi:hypothetical protein